MIQKHPETGPHPVRFRDSGSSRKKLGHILPRTVGNNLRCSMKGQNGAAPQNWISRLWKAHHRHGDLQIMHHSNSKLDSGVKQGAAKFRDSPSYHSTLSPISSHTLGNLVLSPSVRDVLPSTYSIGSIDADSCAKSFTTKVEFSAGTSIHCLPDFSSALIPFLSMTGAVSIRFPIDRLPLEL